MSSAVGWWAAAAACSALRGKSFSSYASSAPSTSPDVRPGRRPAPPRPPLTERTHPADPVPPPDGALGQRVSKIPRNSRRGTSGRPPAPSSGLSNSTCPLGSSPRVRLAALEDGGPELGGQPGRRQGRLAVVVVDVEHAALGAGRRGGLGLEDDGRDAVHVQKAGKGETADAGADDGDRCVHGRRVARPVRRGAHRAAMARSRRWHVPVEGTSTARPQYRIMPGFALSNDRQWAEPLRHATYSRSWFRGCASSSSNRWAAARRAGFRDHRWMAAAPKNTADRVTGQAARASGSNNEPY
jgi:hypothetical protein